ncbi:hypothetical protein M1I95_00680 [Rossellomorea marisflavi]|uniref:hypothetical protein n=1 Tax=Rossellomorea marisflavi TaxID=189381 RepID=UPI00279C0485|nr:hypothetical protein [Rossellomorea marisflavi]UTE73094.1 hypothetical protein M1I95_00680 [Rossellomorea marisflavi]
MKNVKRMIVIVLAVSLIAFGFVYWFKLAPAGPLPDDKTTAKEINGLLNKTGTGEGLQVKSILDTVQADDRHAFIPFETDAGARGFSLWIWKDHQWKASSATTDGDPVIWKVRPGYPSSYRMVWSLDPAEKVDRLAFYLIQERSFQNEAYQPRIQMEKVIPFAEHPYGAIKVPAEWRTILRGEVAEFEVPGVEFGWRSLDSSGEDVFIEGQGQYSYLRYQDHQDLMIPLEKDELE